MREEREREDVQKVFSSRMSLKRSILNSRSENDHLSAEDLKIVFPEDKTFKKIFSKEKTFKKPSKCFIRDFPGDKDYKRPLNRKTTKGLLCVEGGFLHRSP